MGERAAGAVHPIPLYSTIACRDGRGMVAKVRTVAFHGVEVIEVETQVTIGSGLPAFTVVGLPDKAVAESRERGRAARAGPRSAAATHHRQPRSRRGARGGQPLRPAHRAGS